MRERTCERWRQYACASVTTATSSAATRDGGGNAIIHRRHTLIQKSRSIDRSIGRGGVNNAVGRSAVDVGVMVVVYVYVT